MPNPDRPTIDPSEEPPTKRTLITGTERRRLAPLENPENMNMPMDDNMLDPPGIPRAQVNQRMVDFERQQQQANNDGENGENNVVQEEQRGGKRSRRSRTRRSRTRRSRTRKSRFSRRYRRSRR